MLATAAFLDGLAVTGLDQTGLSQKAGPVVSHLRLRPGEPEASNAVGEESADLLLALDLLVAAEPKHLARLRPTGPRPWPSPRWCPRPTWCAARPAATAAACSPPLAATGPGPAG